MVRRGISHLVLIVLAVLTWARSLPLQPDPFITLTISPERLPPPAVMARYLGPFALEGAWHLQSGNEMFFGYSALVPQPDGALLAFNDAGATLRFAPPGTNARHPVEARWIRMKKGVRAKSAQDVESAVAAPDGGYWLGLESTNQIVRIDAALVETGRVAPRLMRGWGDNTGPEAMARLADRRFVVIREVTTSLFEPRRHAAVLFDSDPIEGAASQRFWFDGADNFSVVDMTLLPDGRALILMRRLIWPFPMRFAGRIVIADTRHIRAGGTWRSIPLASLASTLPVDNFEAIAAVPRPDGRVTVWLMSDDNRMRTLQRTLLWELSVDPAALPWPRD